MFVQKHIRESFVDLEESLCSRSDLWFQHLWQPPRVPDRSTVDAVKQLVIRLDELREGLIN